MDRLETQLNASDNNIAGSRVLVSATYSNNSDGSARSVDLERPFYQLDARWAGGVSASNYTRTDSLYDRGAIIDQFREHTRDFQAYGGWSPGLHDGWVERFSLGVTHGYRERNHLAQALQELRR